jgi:drug/metabolite transporter (DMT)-like permease
MSDHLIARERRAAALVMFGAICISFAPVFVKMLGSGSIGPTAIGFWRTLFGSTVLFLWCLATRRTLLIPRPAVPYALLAGFFFFLDLAFWHRSILYTGAGMATILGNTQVFATSVFAWLIFKERLTVRFVIAAVAAVFGVILLSGVLSAQVELTPTYLAGVGFGLATGLVYAGFLLSLRRGGQLEKPPDPVAFMAWTSLATAVFSGIESPLEAHPVVPPNMQSYAILLALGIVAQAVGWRTISAALPRLATARSSLILLLQPTLATAWGLWFFHESLVPMQLLGAVITLAAIYFGSLRK